MFKLFYKKCYFKVEDLPDCCLSKNDVLSNDILTHEDYNKIGSVCAKLGLKDVDISNIICYCNNIIYVDFERKRVFFNVGVYYKY